MTTFSQGTILNLLTVILAVGPLSACKDTEGEAPSSSVAPRNLENFFPASPAIEQPAVEEPAANSAGNSAPTSASSSLEIVCNAEMVVATEQKCRSLAIGKDGSKAVVTSLTTWSVDVADVAQVKNPLNGSIEAIKAGKFQVIAQYGNLTAEQTIEVTDAEVIDIQVMPRSVVAGSAQRFSAEIIFSNGTTQVVTDETAWTSSNSLIAAPINGAPLGTFQVKVPGNFAVSAVFGNLSVTVPIQSQMLPLSSIQVKSASSVLNAGVSEQFVAIGHFKNETSRDITQSVSWRSTNPQVVTADNTLGSKGLVYAATGGFSTVFAAFDGVVGSKVIEVSTEQFASLSIENADKPLPIGIEKALKLIGRRADGSTLDVTATAIWTSSNPYLVTISNDLTTAGVASAWSIGSLVIAASFGGAMVQAPLEVVAAEVISLVVKGPEGAVDCGIAPAQFTANATFSDDTEDDVTAQVTWATNSSTYAIASNTSGSNGQVSTLKEGQTAISATFRNVTTGTEVTATKSLTIAAPILMSYIVESAAPSVAIGSSLQFSAKGSYSCVVALPPVLTTEVTWSSSNPKAAISNTAPFKGKVTTSGSLIAPEQATITATKGAITGQTSLEIRPKEVTSVSLSGTADRIDVGNTIGLTLTATYSDGSTGVITSGLAGHIIDYATSNPLQASISAAGVVTGLAEGFFNATVTVTTPRFATISSTFSMGVQSICSAPGIRRGLFCWYYGTLGQSCGTVCSDRTLAYNAGTRTFAGDLGSGGNCGLVLGAYALGSLSKDNQTGIGGQGLGCSTLESGGVVATRRYITPATDAFAFHPNVRRLCACSP